VKALAALLCVLLAVPAYAADDAPIVLDAGATAPVAGVLLPDAVAVAAAKRLKGCEAERDSLKAAPGPMHPAIIVGLVVLGVLAGGAAGYGVARAVK